MNNGYWLKSGFFTFFEKASVLLFGFGGFYFLVRIFPKEEFGLWALFLTVTTLVEFSRVGLIQNAVVKYVATSHEDEMPNIISASFFLNISLTVLSVIALFVLAKPLSVYWQKPQLEDMMHWYALTTIALIPFSQFNYLQQALLDFKSVFYSSFVRQGTNFVFVAIVYFAHIKIDFVNLVNIQSLGAILGSMVAFVLIRGKVKLSFKFSATWLVKLLKFGVFTLGTNISSILLKSVDQWILASILKTTTPGATYNVCARLFNLFEVPVTTIATVVFPQSAKRIAEQGVGAAKDLYERSVALMVAIVLPGILFFLLFPDFILLYAAGVDYVGDGFILQITMVQVFLLPFQRQFGTILDSMGKPKLNFFVTLFTMSLNVGLNYVFVNEFKQVGSAYATTITYFVSVSVMLVLLNRIIGVNILNVFKNIPVSYLRLKDVLLKR